MGKNTPTSHLLLIGFGYTARHLAHAALAKGWMVSGTTRIPEKTATISAANVAPVLWPDSLALPVSLLDTVTHIVVSAPPHKGGCPVWESLRPFLQNFAQLRHLLYYSSTGVYGDSQGQWLDETSPVTPHSPRAQARLMAEENWQIASAEAGFACTILRLAGIYGPGRNAMETLLKQQREGAPRRLYREGLIFNRIHVADIIQITLSLLEETPCSNNLFNLADDTPAPPEDVTSFAACLLGVPTPPLIRFDQAGLSPAGLEFFSQSRKIRNTLVKKILNYFFLYPDYKTGLLSLLNTVNQDY